MGSFTCCAPNLNLISGILGEGPLPFDARADANCVTHTRGRKIVPFSGIDVSLTYMLVFSLCPSCRDCPKGGGGAWRRYSRSDAGRMILLPSKVKPRPPSPARNGLTAPICSTRTQSFPFVQPNETGAKAREIPLQQVAESARGRNRQSIRIIALSILLLLSSPWTASPPPLLPLMVQLATVQLGVGS